MDEATISIYRLAELGADQRLALLQRAESDLSEFDEKVVPIIEAVRMRGDEALVDFATNFDRSTISIDTIRVSAREFTEARASLSRELIAALEFAADNIRDFHEKQMPDSLSLHETRSGAIVGDRWTSIDSVACYVPRGKGSFPSSVLMTAIPAVVAGVEKVVIITPPDRTVR